MAHFALSVTPRLAAVMLFVSLVDVAIVASLAVGSILAPLVPAIVAMLLGATMAFVFTLDAVKRIAFASLPIG